jgi:monoamine oxidase
MQRSAIRQLQYGHSTKIGVLFKSPWWKDCNQIGGQSSTDLPIRRIVYPSYGPDHESNVLIASYCWTYDADTMARLIGSGTEGLLEDLVLRNLAEVHGVSVEFLRDQHVKTFPYDWSHNPWAGGTIVPFLLLPPQLI